MIDFWGHRVNETVDNFMGAEDRAIAEQNVAPHRSRVHMIQACVRFPSRSRLIGTESRLALQPCGLAHVVFFV